MRTGGIVLGKPSQNSKASDRTSTPWPPTHKSSQCRNAAKSTGPNTEKGKAEDRLNALNHGGRAKTTGVMPVLPHEDPKQLEERIQTWIDDWQPRNALERELVLRAARLSWMLERSERFEAAHLAHRVRLAGRRPGRRSPPGGCRSSTTAINHVPRTGPVRAGARFTARSGCSGGGVWRIRAGATETAETGAI